jgi:hypothetical protein
MHRAQMNPGPPWPGSGTASGLTGGADAGVTTVLPPVGAEPAPASPLPGAVTGRRRADLPLMILPSPPTEEEKYWYLGQQNRWFLWAGVAAGLLVLISLVKFALNHPITWVFLAPVLLRVVTTAVGLITSSRRRRVSLASHRDKVGSWRPGMYPSVDVFLPSCGEDLQVLANTYWHVSQLQWPGQLIVHVLDDSARGEVAELAAGYGSCITPVPTGAG